MKKRVALAAGMAAAAVTGSIALTVSHISAATTPAGLEAATQHGPTGSSGDGSGTSNGDAVPPAEAAKRATTAAAALVAKSPKSFFKGAHDKLVTHSGRQPGRPASTSRTSARTNGVPVQGGDAVVVTDSAGKVLGNYSAQEQVLSVGTKAKVTPQAAVQVARKQLAKVDVGQRRERSRWWPQGPGVLAYEVVVTGTKQVEGHLAPSHLHVFVDATTGTVLTELTRDDVVDAAGKGDYYGNVTLEHQGLRRPVHDEPTRPVPACSAVARTAAPSPAPPTPGAPATATDLVTGCVDAMYVGRQEWNMLRDWLGRNGIDGNGRGFPIRVGLNDVNAFWNGSRVEFGHSSDNRRLLTMIDVLGHEFGHAINQFTPGGSSGGNEAGGMNESTGDIFGALTEFYANNAERQGRLHVGELANLVGNGPIRYMADPSKARRPELLLQPHPQHRGARRGRSAEPLVLPAGRGLPPDQRPAGQPDLQQQHRHRHRHPEGRQDLHGHADAQDQRLDATSRPAPPRSPRPPSCSATAPSAPRSRPPGTPSACRPAAASRPAPAPPPTRRRPGPRRRPPRRAPRRRPARRPAAHGQPHGQPDGQRRARLRPVPHALR